MSKIKRFVNNYIPIFAIVCLCLSFVSFIVLLVAKSNVAFAEFISSGIGSFFRRFLSYVFGIFPFSFAELMLILVPLIITVVIILAVRCSYDKRRAIRFLFSIVAVLSLFYTSYVYTIGTGYHREPISDKLSVSSDNPTADELYDTMLILAGELNKLVPSVEFDENGSSVCPLGENEVSSIINDAYARVAEKHEGLQLDVFTQSAKPVILSKGMTYLELLGIYTYFTGECNVNVHYPDYTLPFSIAHEFAHSRGISRENEANFLAFLVCINADNDYIRYSGYMNMYEYLASALNRADKELLRDVYSRTDDVALGEIVAYFEFYQANQVEFLGDLSDFVNDKYLKAQGTEGIVSYGLAVRLCVGYYKR